MMTSSTASCTSTLAPVCLESRERGTLRVFNLGKEAQALDANVIGNEIQQAELGDLEGPVEFPIELGPAKVADFRMCI